MKKWAKYSYLMTVYFLLYLPLVVLIVYSFNNAKFSLQWQGFSIKWYAELFQDTALWQAFFHSVFLGIISSIIATILSLLLTLHLFLHKSKNQSLFGMLFLLIIIPDIVLGVALLIFFNFINIPPGFLSLIIAHITFCIPFAVISINSRMHTLDANIYFSALDLGASRLTALIRILLPLLWPAVLSSALLCFTLSFDDVIISYFVAGPNFSILPLTIFSLVRTGVTPELNALCSITIIISMLLVISSQLLLRKGS